MYSCNLVYSGLPKAYFKIKNSGEQEKIIRYSYEGRIEKSDHRDHRLSYSASLVMPNGDPRDGFFYPTLTLMIDSYIITDCRITHGTEEETRNTHTAKHQ